VYYDESASSLWPLDTDAYPQDIEGSAGIFAVGDQIWFNVGRYDHGQQGTPDYPLELPGTAFNQLLLEIEEAERDETIFMSWGKWQGNAALTLYYAHHMDTTNALQNGGFGVVSGLGCAHSLASGGAATEPHASLGPGHWAVGEVWRIYAASSLITNGDLENWTTSTNADDWTESLASAGTVTETTPGNESQTCARIVSGNGTTYMEQSFTTVVGKAYYARCMHKTVNSTHLGAGIQLRDSGGLIGSLAVGAIYPDWIELYATAVATETTTTIRIYVTGDVTYQAGSGDFDKVECGLAQLAAPPRFASKPATFPKPYLDIPAGSLSGQLPALAKISITPMAYDQGIVHGYMYRQVDAVADNSCVVAGPTMLHTEGTARVSPTVQIGVLFDSVHIPHNASIGSATLYMTSTGDYTYTTGGMTIGAIKPRFIRGGFSTQWHTNANFLSDPTTSLAPGASWAAGEQSVAVHLMLNELVESKDWKSGDPVALILKDNGSMGGSDFYEFAMSEGGGEWRLYIRYSVPSAIETQLVNKEKVQGGVTAVTIAGHALAGMENFRAFLPFSRRDPDTTFYVKDGSGGVFDSPEGSSLDLVSASQEHIRVDGVASETSGVLVDRARITVTGDAIKSYVGNRFRALLKYYLSDSSSTPKVSFSITTANRKITTPTRILSASRLEDVIEGVLLADLGEVAIPKLILASGMQSELVFEVSTTDPYPGDLHLLELVLLPTSFYVSASSLEPKWEYAAVATDTIMLDSTLANGYAEDARCRVYNISGQQQVQKANWKINTGDIQLPVNQGAYRLWFLMTSDNGIYDSGSKNTQRVPSGMATVDVEVIERFSGI